MWHSGCGREREREREKEGGRKKERERERLTFMLKPKHTALAGPNAISLVSFLPTPVISGRWQGLQELRP